MDPLDRFLQNAVDLLLLGTLHVLAQRRPVDARPSRETVDRPDQNELVVGLLAGLGAFLIQAAREVPLSAAPFFVGFVIGYLAGMVVVRRDRTAFVSVLLVAVIAGLTFVVPMWVCRLVIVACIVVELTRCGLGRRRGLRASRPVESR